MTHPLEGCRLKIAQAVEDFDALHAEIVEFTKDNPYPMSVEDDAQTGEQVISIGEPPTLSPKWGVRVGLIAYSARSALDHLVYELAAKGGGEPERDRTQFPIAVDRDEYLREGRGRRKGTRSYRDRCLAGVREDWREKIDEVQPYNYDADPHRHPLAVLGELSNRDKHRTLNPAYGAIKTGRFVVSPTGPVSFRNVEIRTTAEGVKVKAEFKFARAPSRDTDIITVEHQVDVGRPGAEVVFQCGNRLIRLSEVKAAVRWPVGVVDWLTPAFDE